MTIRDAFTQLATWTISGVENNYDLDDLPAKLAAAELPALVPHLIETREDQDTQAMAVLTYDQSIWWATIYIEHYCYFELAGKSRLEDVRPAMITFVDNYLAEAAGDGDLNGELAEPLAIKSVNIGKYAYPPGAEFGDKYYCCVVVQQWRMEVDVS